MSLSTPTVLFIDDDPALGRLVQRGLGRRGYTVEIAASAEEGRAFLATTAPAVIVLDHYLPTGTGLDFLRTLRETNSPPPVVYVTASGETSVAVAALKAGAADYVAKTADDEFLELLSRALDQALENARLKRERDIAEREVRLARDRAEALLKEVNHRVANSLAMVAALAAMQMKTVSDPQTRNALTEFQGRITAIAGVHRRLYTKGNVRSVEMAEYLAGLVQELETTIQAAGHSSHVRLTAEAIEVPTDKAVSIGVIVTELVSNAFKYAYPAPSGGEIRVDLSTSGANRVRLSVDDDGIGWVGSGTVKGTGLGTRIVSTMALGLGGVVTYGAGPGCHVALEFDI